MAPLAPPLAPAMIIFSISHAVSEETHQAIQLSNYLKNECASLYSPVVSQQIIAPRLNLESKGDYLCMKQKSGGLLPQSKWVLAYFFTQAGNLMKQEKDQVAGSVLVDLNEDGVCVDAIQSDERRNLFQINIPKERRYVVLQCINEKERDEWVATINNIIRESGFIKRTSITSGDDASSDTASVYADILPADQIHAWLVSQPIQFDLSPINFQDETAGALEPIQSANERYSRLSRVSPSVEIGQEIDEKDANQVQPNDSQDQQEADPKVQFRSTPPIAKHVDSFSMRFIGCVKVPSPAGEDLITSVIRHVMKTRASHDIFRMSEVECNISTRELTLSTALEAYSPNTVVNVPIKKITCTSVHKDNARLFGFIAGPYDMSSPGSNSPPALVGRYICYAFECEDGNQISRAVRTAKRQADPQKKRETALLLESIMRLPDMSTSSPLPDADKKTYRLAANLGSLDNADVFDEEEDIDPDKPPHRPDEADGDERSVEGAENCTA